MAHQPRRVPITACASPEFILKDRSTHISANISSRGVRKDLGIMRAVIRRHLAVRDKISSTRLHLFASVETSYTYLPLWRALVERWWDTIDTFHTSVGEWIVTPFEFAILTRIHFGFCPLHVDTSLLTLDRLNNLVGFMPATDGGGLYRHNMLCEQLKALSRASKDVAITDRLARASLLLILRCTIAHDWVNHVDLGFVQSLVDLSLLREYDWVEAFMASMYHDMSLYSRRASSGLGGIVAIWEAWTYPFFPFTTPILTREVPREILVMGCFRPSLVEKHVKEDYLTMRRRYGTIRWYFLGEMVYLQVMGLCQISANPLVDMLNGDTYAGWVTSTLSTIVEPPPDRSSVTETRITSHGQSGEADPEEEFDSRLTRRSSREINCELLSHHDVVLMSHCRIDSVEAGVSGGRIVAYEAWWVAKHGDREREHRATLIREIYTRLQTTTEMTLDFNRRDDQRNLTTLGIYIRGDADWLPSPSMHTDLILIG
ncbi:hypothetical protein JCGZ_06392 [Jatropha curcas]|uniref:Aminotransferase-like plant mobile domain-containing protein n=1 Tax=Jatropha curcas TaxID=180498 RepID=A0A067KNZ0_JATCU|nr:hypothetical protein JCGZ_06392 [Jatropha curcas]